MNERNKTTDKHRNKTKPVSFKLPDWFLEVLSEAKEKLPKRTATEIIIRGTCKTEKKNIPKDYKFAKRK